MKRKIHITGLTLFFTLALLSLAFSEESMTITTYYPSPYGSYNELTTTGNTYLTTTSGSVGIGTTAPGTKLDTTGTIRSTGLGNAVSGVGAEMAYSSDVGYFITYDRNTAGIKATHLGGDGASGLRVDALGNVGIGTTAPVSNLQVVHTVTGIITDIVVGDQLGVQTTYGTIQTSADTGGYFNIQSVRWSGAGGAYGDIVLNRDGGNVGIGTAAPNSRLEVVQASASDRTVILRAFANTLYNRNPLEFRKNDNTVVANIWRAAGASDPLRVKSLNNIQFHTNNVAYDGSTPQMTIDTSGRVGIGTSSPTYQLQLSTDSAAKPTSSSWTIASDRRLKKNIKPLKSALDKMLKLHGVTFQWKEPQKQGNMAGTYMGLIGQEVERVFPEWVKTDALGYKDITVTGFEALTVEAIRELKAENDALKAKIEALELKLNAG